MINLKRLAGSQNVQRWEIEANVVPTNDSANFLVHSILSGYDQVVYVRMPQVYGITLTTGHTVDGALAIGDDTFKTHATTINAGEFIQFGTDTKVYLVTVGGASSIKIAPKLLKVVADNAAIKTGGAVTMLARYDTGVKLGITYKDGVLSDPGSIRLIEAL